MSGIEFAASTAEKGYWLGFSVASGLQHPPQSCGVGCYHTLCQTICRFADGWQKKRSSNDIVFAEETVRHPDLEELLQPVQNAMQILGVGPLEMAVTQLNVLERQGQGQKRAPAFCTPAQLLRGVLQFIRNDEKNAREFVEKGNI